MRYMARYFCILSAFNEKFDIAHDPSYVIVDFKDSRIADMSAIEAENKLTDRYGQAGKDCT